MIHELKILRQFFERVLDGSKTFEIRRDNRGFQANDYVRLREIDGGTFRETCTGRESVFRIGYVSNFEQKPEWVVFSILPLRDGEAPR